VDYFSYKGQRLYAEDVSCEEIADSFSTPTYVYSAQTLRRHVRVLKEGLGQIEHHICYAVKACANLAIIQLLAKEGVGFDAVSVGELARVLKAGVSPDRVILSGVGKRDDEIEAAIRADVMYVCIESQSELESVAKIAELLKQRVRVAIRVNPDVNARTHPYIATGLKKNKFGVPLDQALSLYRRFSSHPLIDCVGVTCHIGSQIVEKEPFEDAARHMKDLAKQLLKLGVPLRYIGLGGGLGVPYRDESPPTPDEYGDSLARIIGDLGLVLVVEPGRVIVGNSGILLTRVVRRKKGDERSFLIVDAGMNDLLRPALYQASHDLIPVWRRAGDSEPVDVVGPVCESADTFAQECALPPVEEGDLLAIRTAGAYGFVMSSNYNGRPRCAEILVDEAQVKCIRQREGLADLWRLERSLDGAVFDESEPNVLNSPENTSGHVTQACSHGRNDNDNES
jgi:diaminopimelate decarboxylase